MISNSKYLTFPEVGPVHFEKSKKAKRIVISVKSTGKVRVAVPRFVSFRKAESFVKQKLNWIIAQQSKISKKISALSSSTSISNIEKVKIKNRAELLANKYGFSCNRITFRKMKTRWGSCTHTNNISLNIGLVALTDELIDYIILHELVHTKIKNHSKEFWAELSKFIENPKTLNKKLKNNYSL